MSLFKLFPSCINLLEASVAARIERCFENECARTGTALNAQAAERLGMRMLADAVSGLPSAEVTALSWLLVFDGPGAEVDAVPFKLNAS